MNPTAKAGILSRKLTPDPKKVLADGGNSGREKNRKKS
jgi:hypothetical protein